eukprot:TRINITY_DN12036_c0_g2_i1.p1 TRINITY_DN12036_c0_g2~~TRINITY_DN12036_c0_g2_i1.p1  ORF type:complete len:276 (+),score=-29.14 TRINITY_DN12036_c0_g2_i1:34-828(+)
MSRSIDAVDESIMQRFAEPVDVSCAKLPLIPVSLFWSTDAFTDCHVSLAVFSLACNQPLKRINSPAVNGMPNGTSGCSGAVRFLVDASLMPQCARAGETPSEPSSPPPQASIEFFSSNVPLASKSRGRVVIPLGGTAGSQSLNGTFPLRAPNGGGITGEVSVRISLGIANFMPPRGSAAFQLWARLPSILNPARPSQRTNASAPQSPAARSRASRSAAQEAPLPRTPRATPGNGGALNQGRPDVVVVQNPDGSVTTLGFLVACA